MNPWTLHRWRGCLLGTGVTLILLIVLVSFYTWLFLRHTGSTQVRVARPTETSAQAVIKDSSPTAPFELPADGLWTAVCRHRYPEDWAIDWTLSINLRARSFDARAKWTRQVTESDGWLYSHQLDHDGLGSITEDGMLEGPFREVTTLVLSKGGVVTDPQVTEYEGGMYGVISADLKTMCISRGEDPGAYDVDYIRRIGREAFFGPDAGCEADCAISTGP